jgi:hypothetical protein
LVGVFNLSNLRDLIERTLISFLGDQGYSHGQVLTQNSVASSLIKILQFLRGIIEIVFGLVHSFKAATLRVREKPSMQTMMLICIYEISDHVLRQHLIRPDLLKKNFSKLARTALGPVGSASDLEKLEQLLDDLDQKESSDFKNLKKNKSSQIL